MRKTSPSIPGERNLRWLRNTHGQRVGLILARPARPGAPASGGEKMHSLFPGSRHGPYRG